MACSVALVTASSAGLGAATAKGLAEAGFNIVLNYNENKSKADEVAKYIRQLNHHPSQRLESRKTAQSVQCIAIQADMSRPEEVKRLVQETINHFGKLDIVVSNQGWTKMRQFNDLDDNMDMSDWDLCFNMNVKSHLTLFHAAQPHLKTGKGSFITIASLAGVIPSGSSIPYAVTKAAQIHLVRCLAKIGGPEIAVNSVSPGILLTDWGQNFSDEKLTEAIEKSRLKKLADIEDVVQHIVYLAKGRSVTGQNIIIDAGWSAG